jgi:hypothetical protein
VTEEKTGLDFEVLRSAIEGLDDETLIGLYADDAELRLVNRPTPPSSPHVLRGRSEIAEYLHAVFGREMTLRVERKVVGEDRVGYSVACEYPDGARVPAAKTLDLRDGRIYRQVEVTAWDE